MKAIELLESLFSLAVAPLAGAAGLWLVAAAEASERAVAAIRDTNLRRAPGIESEVQMLIPKGTTVEVGDCRNGWCRVSRKRQDGYLVARNLSFPAGPQWPPAFWQGYDDRSWLRASEAVLKTAHEEGPTEHSVILEIGGAGE
jgi:hypothetical protein